MSDIPQDLHGVFFCDGSTAPLNPGYGGAGVFGYFYKLTERHRNFKHPIHNTLFFTTKGIASTKEETPIEVVKILEVVKAINNPTTTNNESELVGFMIALEKTFATEGVKSVTIITDSNYIVSSFNENMNKWVENNWRRQDNKPIAHIAEWTSIIKYRDYFKSINVDVNVVWVKGHSESYCNSVADVYSAIASNSAKRQATSNQPLYENVLDLELSYADYKKSYQIKDIILFFRDMYFSSSKLDDSNYCFLSTSEAPNTVGKRDTASIFANNVGYAPPIINRIKEVFRSVQRDHVATCCVKLSKLENKEIYRLTSYINLEDLLVKANYSGRLAYLFVRDTTPFIFENGLDYPFIVNAIGLFSRMQDVINDANVSNPNRHILDITDRVVKEGKVVFSNKDKNLDFSDLMLDKVNFKQKLLLTIGYDIPSYLALKNLEGIIKKVELIVDCKPDSNFCTLYVNVTTDTRNLYSVNIENKFLRSR